MTRAEILIEVEGALARLLEVRRLLSESAKSQRKIERISKRAVAAAIKNSPKGSTTAPKYSTTAKTAKKKRQLSDEGRRRIILGQKKRWARQRSEKKS